MAQLSKTMKAALVQFAQRGDFTGFRSSTVTALERRGLIKQQGDGYTITDPKRVAEQIGNAQRLAIRYSDTFDRTPTIDWKQADYAFWDKARRGQAQGLEISGAFLKPIENKIASWVMGDRFGIRCEHDYTQQRLNDWLTKVYTKIVETMRESVGLGDFYLVINPPSDDEEEITVTAVSPHVVKPIVAEDDYSQQIGWEIKQTYPHPADSFKYMQIIDQWTEQTRVRRVYLNGRLQRTETYRNLIGMIPVIHVPNNKRADEKNGRPEAEPVLPILYHYNAVFSDAITGNRKQGRPTPVIEKMGSIDQIQKFWETFGRLHTYTDPDTGQTISEYELDISSDRVMTLGGDAVFNYKAPGSFTGDTSTLLGLLFYLIVQHSEMPEFIFGNAIQGSRASAETQMPAFVRFIEAKQSLAEGWVLQVIRVVAAMFALFDRQVRADENFSIKWAPLTEDAGQLLLQVLQWLYSIGLIDDMTTLEQAPAVDIEDVAAVLQKAQDEAQARQDAFDAAAQATLDRLASQDDDDSDNDEGGDTDPDGEDSTEERAKRLTNAA